MKVVHINNFDISGGAAQAANRIHNALLNQGVDSKYLVQFKSSSSNLISGFNESYFQKLLTSFRSYLDTFERKAFTEETLGKFSYGSIGINITKHRFVEQADIINLHWINNGFLSLKTLNELLNLNKPIVWTLHDMWAFTGGCHYSGTCKKYKTECSYCPYLLNSKANDKSYKIFNHKKDIYTNKKLSFVTCSNWLGKEAKDSALIKDKEIVAISNPIDIVKYLPIDKKRAKQTLSLDVNKIHILFGTWSLKDKRKGFHLLKEAMLSIQEIYPDSNIELLVFGKVDKNELDLPFKVHSFGRINNEVMISNIYSASDFSIVPSLEDNFPNTVIESLSCGTPVVAYNIGGIPEMIEHKVNGYLATELSSDSLFKGIKWFIDNHDQLKQFSEAARNKVIENYTYEKIGALYKNRYEYLLK